MKFGTYCIRLRRKPVNLFRLIAILCIFLVPFFLVHSIGRGFERIQKAISYLFWQALICTLSYIIWYTAWGSYQLWGNGPFFGNELLAFGSFFMYLLLLKLRERMTGDDAWDRLTRFFAPALFFYIMMSVIMIHMTYVNAVALGATELQQKNPLHYALSNFGYPFAFYFIFLSYLECKDLLKSLKVVHKPLVISAFLVITSLLLWLYEQWCIFLFRDTPFYRDVVQLSRPIWLFTDWWTIELLPGFIGSIIAVVNMVFLYKQLKKPLPIMGEEEAGRYVIGVFKFLTGISKVIGGTSLTIFRSTVEGYNERFGRNIRIDDTIQLSGLSREEWPAFIRFMLDVYYQCIGPITWDIARDVEELKGFVESGSVSLDA